MSYRRERVRYSLGVGVAEAEVERGEARDGREGGGEQKRERTAGNKSRRAAERAELQVRPLPAAHCLTLCYTSGNSSSTTSFLRR